MRLWVLLGWSPEYGAAVIAVGVLGFETGGEITESFVEWVPREYEAGRIWRERLVGTSPQEVVERMAFWAESLVASAAEVEPIVPGATLEAAVRAQVDDVLGSAR
ncbi:hypothetical protein DMA12_19590 [Amycolatopsis balhimycina DSM 5908]|uniref:Uncharacterized protein n=1 Tax=Amycolatopsis balhimycina DSM 5908 TaxID=1081091 RepID=A0A428WJ86_AMYBA|nr:hypothetical protein [Amycolatopsis balhimycina]RSM43154.1 hypothetical protein DMA12_19590 [Amycolatopsis balhimycina DSM 5908]